MHTQKSSHLSGYPHSLKGYNMFWFLQAGALDSNPEETDHRHMQDKGIWVSVSAQGGRNLPFAPEAGLHNHTQRGVVSGPMSGQKSSDKWYAPWVSAGANTP